MAWSLSFFARRVAKFQPQNTLSLGLSAVTFPSMFVEKSWNDADATPGNQSKERSIVMQEMENIKPPRLAQRVVIITLGWILIIGGIVGLFLPILPGGVLLLAGALILSPQSALLRRALEKCRARFPLLERALKRFTAWG